MTDDGDETVEQAMQRHGYELDGRYWKKEQPQ
jgi:hypothetical protein